MLDAPYGIVLWGFPRFQVRRPQVDSSCCKLAGGLVGWFIGWFSLGHSMSPSLPIHPDRVGSACGADCFAVLGSAPKDSRRPFGVSRRSKTEGLFGGKWNPRVCDTTKRAEPQRLTPPKTGGDSDLYHRSG